MAAFLASSDQPLHDRQRGRHRRRPSANLTAGVESTVWRSLAFQLCRQRPEKSAQFWTENFDLQEIFRSDEAIALTNNAMIIGFFKGTPHPDTVDHTAFISRACARYAKRSRR